MTVQIPDAPWIRDAENNGMPDGDDVYCPVCNDENPEYFYVQDGEVIGCSECVERVDPFEWADDHPEVSENPFDGDDEWKQYCRYCAFCFEADDFRCSNHPDGKQLHMTREQINRPNKCPNFALSDLGDVETGKPYRPQEARKPRRASQIATTISIFDEGETP